MKYFEVRLVGYDTCEWNTKRETQIIQAESEDEALEIANKWCVEHTYMGGYEWSTESVKEVSGTAEEEEKEKLERKKKVFKWNFALQAVYSGFEGRAKELIEEVDKMVEDIFKGK